MQNLKVISQFFDPFSPLKLHVRYHLRRYYPELYRSLSFFVIFLFLHISQNIKREKMQMYLYIYTYTCIYLQICIFIYIYMFICIYSKHTLRFYAIFLISTSFTEYKYIHYKGKICKCIYIHVYMHIYIYVYVYTYICTYSI